MFEQLLTTRESRKKGVVPKRFNFFINGVGL